MSKILSIETSCDETAVSLLECDGGPGGTCVILGNTLYSQAEKHALFGGVYPSLAKREHQENLVPLTVETMRQAGELKEKSSPKTYDVLNLRDAAFTDSVSAFLSKYETPDIDFIAVTQGPGLEPALWTGITYAEALGKAWQIPVFGIDHMEGHIVSALLTQATERSYHLANPKMPMLSLLISGGHTELILASDWFKYNLVGRTKDDAVGEAFDKVARLLDLSYPGGPEIARIARLARDEGPSVIGKDKTPLTFPRPMAHDTTCDFSFSGLKTAVLYKMKGMTEISEADKQNIAQAFEEAAAATLVMKTRRAMAESSPKTLVVGGGVSANEFIREGLTNLVENEFPKTDLFFPDRTLTGDNAIMVGAAAYLRSYFNKLTAGDLVARGNQRLS